MYIDIRVGVFYCLFDGIWNIFFIDLFLIIWLNMNCSIINICIGMDRSLK